MKFVEKNRNKKKEVSILWGKLIFLKLKFYVI